jgi:uncharacterized protein (DUF1015 family)
VAIIAPLRGVLYNRELIGDLSQVVTPPYDLINEQGQEEYYRRHPYNIIRLDLGRVHPEDTPDNNRYTRAARELDRWAKDRILIRDGQPALYPYRIRFSVPDQGPRILNGFIALLGLEPFHSGKVRPHEMTFSAHKEDRYQLFRHCRMQFCPIFSLYSDPQGEIEEVLSRHLPQDPFIDFTDTEGLQHQVWKITDPTVTEKVRVAFKEKTVYIADGHHRYETSLKFQEEMRRLHPHLGDEAPFHYTLMFFCPMEDPGLTILPVHRLLNRPPDKRPRDWLERLEAHFEVERIFFGPGDKERMQEVFLARLAEKGHGAAVFGLYLSRASHFSLLTLKKNAENGDWTQGLHPLHRELDVTVLSQLVFQRVLAIPAEELDRPQTVTYCQDARQSIAWVEEGPDRMAFLLNPTPVDQVRKIAEASLVMPRKSTYFYPKTLTGLVMHSLDVHETFSA